MNRMKLGLVFSLVIAAAGSAWANGSGTGTVTVIGGQFADGSYPASVYFGISPAPTGRPGCSTSGSYHFVFDPSTAQGKALYAALLVAKANNTPINIYGTGTCGFNQPMEQVVFWKFDAT